MAEISLKFIADDVVRQLRLARHLIDVAIELRDMAQDMPEGDKRTRLYAAAAKVLGEVDMIVRSTQIMTACTDLVAATLRGR